MMNIRRRTFLGYVGMAAAVASGVVTLVPVVNGVNADASCACGSIQGEHNRGRVCPQCVTSVL